MEIFAKDIEVGDVLPQGFAVIRVVRDHAPDGSPLVIAHGCSYHVAHFNADALVRVSR